MRINRWRLQKKDDKSYVRQQTVMKNANGFWGLSGVLRDEIGIPATDYSLNS